MVSGLASGFGVLMVLLGGFVMAISYQIVSDCLRMSGDNPLCWNPTPRSQAFSGAFGFYVGVVITTLGTIILVGPSVARSLGKLKDT